MKLTHYIYLLGTTTAALFTACQSDDVLSPHYTVGEAVKAITLGAGISDGGSGVQTRAGSEGHHTNPGHVNFINGTKLTLRVDGTWTGKASYTLPHGNVTNSAASQTTTAATGAQTGTDNKHNVVTFTDAEQLYWDDYGTADPANATTGRTTGLTIYGVAIDGVTTAPTVSSWTEQTWNVGEPSTGVIDQTGGWAAKDLLTSNNIQVVDNDKPYATDGTYKFEDYLKVLKGESANPSNLLEFTHALTKITVNLTAGEGFPGYETAAANAKFQTAPTVKLFGFNYTGNVNVEAKVSTATPNAKADINMHLAEGGANNNKAKYDALVFPGNQFTATIGAAPDYKPTSSTDILELNADGNIYKVTAAQLVKAIAGTSTTGTPVNGTLEQAKNYILNITVNKTKIEVTATIKAWEDVPTEEAKPKINVTATYGYTTTQGGTGVSNFTNNYDLFRSTDKATGYDEDNTADGINPAASYISSAWNKTIYWPDHQTHYFFRGIYPQVGSSVSGTTALSTPEAVTTVNSNDVVAVANATYTTETYPSDLAIAIPRKTDGTLDEVCKESGHTSQSGICATEGVINMNFEYAMSKVEVRLKSSAEDASHLDLTNANTKVEIIGGYNEARIKLSDGLHDDYADADKGDYKLTSLTTPETGYLVTTLDAIVPQEIGDDVVFRITVTTDNNGTPDDPSDDKIDVYECKVNLIKETTGNTPVAEWEHGKHYIYVLDVNKTALTVTATLKDWVVVTVVDQVWF